MGDELKEAGVKFADAIATMSKNYVAFTISNSLIPIMKGTIMSCMEDSKNEIQEYKGDKKEEKKKEFKDILPSSSKGVEEYDMFNMKIQDMTYISRQSWSYFASYPLFAIRCGKSKKDEGRFFVEGRRYQVRYHQLKKCVENVKAETKDEKLKSEIKELPAEPVWGYFCGCCSKHDDSSTASLAMQAYWKDFVPKFKGSPALADHWRLGDNWEQQQRGYQIFKQAYEQTKLDTMQDRYGQYREGLAPYDETEAMIILLQNIAKEKILPPLYQKSSSIPCEGIRWSVWWNLDATFDVAIETAMNNGWGKVQNAVTAASNTVQKQIDDGADKLAEALKPLLAKIVDVVKGKMKKGGDEKKEEKEEKKEAAIGDIVSTWDFSKTEFGTGVFDMFSDSKQTSLHGGVFSKTRQTIDGAISTTLNNRFKTLAESILGSGAALEIVKETLNKVTNQIVGVFKHFTSLTELLTAAVAIAKPLEQLEKDMTAKKGSKEDCEKAINVASKAMWEELGNISLEMYMNLYQKRTDIETIMAGVCEEGRTPMTDVMDHLFVVQMRLLNAIRVEFTDNLKNKVATDGKVMESNEAVVAAIRTTMRDAVFKYINMAVVEGWTKIASALQASLLAQVLFMFYDKIFPEIEKPLTELEKLIPEPLKNAGLEIIPLAKTVCTTLITSITNKVAVKVVLKVESNLYGKEK